MRTYIKNILALVLLLGVTVGCEVTVPPDIFENNINIDTIANYDQNDEAVLSANKISIEKIANYAQYGGVSPSVSDYTKAGIVGVTSSNIDKVNSKVRTLEYEDVDTKVELNAVVATVVSTTAPQASSNYTIYVYGSDTCPRTTRMRNGLSALGVPFTYINDHSGYNADMWVKLRASGASGSAALPVVDVEINGNMNLFQNPSLENDIKPLIK